MGTFLRSSVRAGPTELSTDQRRAPEWPRRREHMPGTPATAIAIALFAADSVSVVIEPVDIPSDDLDRTADVRGTIAGSPEAVDI